MSATCSSEGCGHPFEAHTDPAILPLCEGTNWPPVSYEGFPWWKKVPATEPVCPCRGFRP